MERDQFAIEPWLAGVRRAIDARLSELVPPEDQPPVRLHAAQRHALLAPGKRIRPAITVVVAEALGGSREQSLDPACAIEMVHTASLVLDDLPSMDDAATRRGRPACHVAHGEDMAILAGIALLNRAFGVAASSSGLDERQRLRLVSLISRMIGDDGIVAGQVRDLGQGVERKSEPDHLERIAREKTGALFVTAAEIGAVVAAAGDVDTQAVCRFAAALGLCFQVLDDLVDHHGCATEAGKDVGQDVDKTTFVTLLGVDGARRRAEGYLDEAVRAIQPLGSRGAQLEDLGRVLMDLARVAAPGA